MRLKRFMALAAAICLLLCGCQRTGELENQAYALILGIDRLPDGALRLTARMPKIGNNGPDSETSGGGKYLTFSAEGADWPSAHEALQRATPRPLNLSHIVLLVVARDAASQDGFAELIRQVAETPHLYTTARLVVCASSAGDFIQALDAVIGTRLSSDLNATLDHYVSEGFIAQSSLAGFYYASGSVYSDPVAAYAGMDGDTDGQPVDWAKRDFASAIIVETPIRQRYGGVALFSGGRLIGVLGPEDARLLAVMRGDSSALLLNLDGEAVELIRMGGADKRVDIRNGSALLRLDLSFELSESVPKSKLQSVIDGLQSVFMQIIARCQALGCDPFGFSERAAARYLTLQGWLSSDWRRLYSDAGIDVRIRIRGQE